MNACLQAGAHPNLIPILGKIINHPEKKDGLVMELIPPNFKNLGNPPSLQSCSRDVFNAETNFTLNQIISIAKGIASVCAQLHSKGINHGDLYAHNILYNENGDNLFGDFGAATFYYKESKEAELIEKIEVRAYGCLLEDLLMNTNTDKLNATFKILEEIKDNCMQENILARPNFYSICKQLL
jgi:serine/threonine protein kinase